MPDLVALIVSTLSLVLYYYWPSVESSIYWPYALKLLVNTIFCAFWRLMLVAIYNDRVIQQKQMKATQLPRNPNLWNILHISVSGRGYDKIIHNKVVCGRCHKGFSSQLITLKSQDIHTVKNWNLQSSGFVAKSSLFRTRPFWTESACLCIYDLECSLSICSLHKYYSSDFLKTPLPTVVAISQTVLWYM